MCVIGKSNSSNSNLSLQQRYDLDFRQFNLSTCQCPYCHTVGRMSPHHTYHRWVLASADTPSVHLRVTVLHCECKTCKHPYHAFLPDWICPFCSFTYTFLLQILGFFYGQGISIFKPPQNILACLEQPFAYSSNVSLLRNGASCRPNSPRRAKDLHVFWH